MSYYPFGLQLCDGTTDSNVQSHRYNGKELDKMHGLNTYDYGARQYNPVTARWDRIDPLCEKYYSISPYAYCANNPVKYVDPDGRKIRYAKNVTKEFKEAFAKACAFMNRHGTKKWLDAIEKRPEIVLIGPPSGTESSSSKKRIHKRNGKVIKASDFMILWNPNQALETNNNVILSPETILAHEAAHMLQTLTDLQGQIKDENTKDGAGEYDNMEEKRVITTVEQETALAHGDIKQGEVTRTDHRGIVVSTFPLSANEPLPSIKEEKQE